MADPFSGLTASLREAENARQVQLERNQFLLQEGEVERNIYLVESGALRVFYLAELEEHCVRFGYEGSMISSLQSFVDQKPSQLYIQAIRRTQLISISRENFYNIAHSDPESVKRYARLLELLVVQVLEREIDLLTHSPVDRYKRVLSRSPQLFQEIPAKYIASYLRMTPETLSRIRRKSGEAKS